MNIAITVNDQTLSARVNGDLVAASVGVVTFTAEFDPTWEGFARTIVFQRKDLSRAVLWTGGEMAVPWEVLAQPGALYISAVGIQAGARRPTARMAEPLVVVPSGKLRGGAPEEYTPALWQQTLEEARRLAARAEELALRPGVPGPPGPQGEKGEPGASPSISMRRYEDGTGSYVEITTTQEGSFQTVRVYDGENGVSPKPYVLPVAGAETIGGVKPVAKTEAMTQAVGVDGEGRLYTEGVSGTEGKSAYQSYVDNGGTLTETQWLASMVTGAPPRYAATLADIPANASTDDLYLLGNGHLAAYGETTTSGIRYTNRAGTISTGRLGSDGTIRNDAPDCRVTDYVPVKNGDVVRIQGMVFNTTPKYGTVTYSGAKDKLSSQALYDGDTAYYTVNKKTGNSAKITVISGDVAYVRFSGVPTVADDEIIVTVNQEIAETTEATVGWMDTGIQFANYALSDADADLIADKLLSRLDVSYVSSDKVLTVGRYTFRYDGEAVADIGVTS